MATPLSSEVLHGALTGDDPTVRSVAALELGRLGFAAVSTPLVAMIVDGRSDVAAAEVLGRIARSSSMQAESVVGEIARALRDTTEAAARLRLVQSVAEIATPGADALLDALATDEDGTVAATATAIGAHRARDVTEAKHGGRERSRQGNTTGTVGETGA